MAVHSSGADGDDGCQIQDDFDEHACFFFYHCHCDLLESPNFILIKLSLKGKEIKWKEK